LEEEGQVQGNLIWIDPVSGMVWQVESPGTMNWSEAMGYAKALRLGGYHDWRLPRAGELETLLDRSELLDVSRYRPSMRKGIPFRDALPYWSSTTFGENTNNAWIVMFDGAYVLSYNKRNRYHIRCVRGCADERGQPCQ